MAVGTRQGIVEELALDSAKRWDRDKARRWREESEAALEADPRDVAARVKRAFVARWEHDDERARREADALCADEPELADAWLLKEHTIDRHLDPAAALEALARAEELGGPSAYIAIGRAFAQLAGGEENHPAARREVERAHELGPGPWLCDLAWAEILLGDREAGFADHERAVAQSGPGDARELNMFGWSLYHDGQLDAALDVFDDAVLRDYDNLWSRTWRARVVLELGDHDSALEDVEIALATFDRVPDPYVVRGHALMGLLLSDEAADSYREAAKLVPRDVAVQIDLALALRRGERYEEALHVLKELRLQHPQNPGVLAHLAAVHLELGDPQKAREVLEPALGLTPRVDDAEAIAAEADRRLGLPERATARLQHIVGRNPSDADAWERLGFAYADLERHQQAAMALHRAWALEPERRLAQVHATAALLAAGEPGSALRLAEGIEEGDQRVELIFNMAVAYERLGQRRESFRALTRASRRTPDDDAEELARLKVQDELAALTATPGDAWLDYWFVQAERWRVAAGAGLLASVVVTLVLLASGAIDQGPAVTILAVLGLLFLLPSVASLGFGPFRVEKLQPLTAGEPRHRLEPLDIER